MHKGTEISQKTAFLKDCFMHILCKSKAQTWSKLIPKSRTLLLYFYLEYLE